MLYKLVKNLVCWGCAVSLCAVLGIGIANARTTDNHHATKIKATKIKSKKPDPCASLTVPIKTMCACKAGTVGALICKSYYPKDSTK